MSEFFTSIFLCVYMFDDSIRPRVELIKPHIPNMYNTCALLFPLHRGCDYWRPGEEIPSPFVPESPTPLSTSTPQLSVNRQENTLVDMLQCFHSSMEQLLSSVCTSLTSINEHKDSLEGRQKSLEEEVRANSSLSSSSI